MPNRHDSLPVPVPGVHQLKGGFDKIFLYCLLSNQIHDGQQQKGLVGSVVIGCGWITVSPAVCSQS
jgi:hypothetical protein